MCYSTHVDALISVRELRNSVSEVLRRVESLSGTDYPVPPSGYFVVICIVEAGMGAAGKSMTYENAIRSFAVEFSVSLKRDIYWTDARTRFEAKRSGFRMKPNLLSS